jgi:hypothetical protein
MPDSGRTPVSTDAHRRLPIEGMTHQQRVRDQGAYANPGQERLTSGAKSPTFGQPFTARLKSCPDTKQSFPQPVKPLPDHQ